MERPSQSDFIREMQRLMDLQRHAIQAKDEAAIEEAAHDVAMLLRFNAAGRMQEYWDRRRVER